MTINGLNAHVTEAVPAIPESNLYEGKLDFDVAAGNTLNIETSPAGEEVFSAEVPEGKKWEVSVSLNIIETDA